MSEGADFDPGPWSGHDFKSASTDFDAHASRSYATAKSEGKTAKDLLPATIETNSTAPLIVVNDVTGSMGKWPQVIFSKLPYLEVEAKKEYLGEDMEICWAAVGDVPNDTYPLQIRPFTKGTALKDELMKLVIEGGGGGTKEESYETMGLYLLKNVKMPRAIRPVVVFIGDEAPYPNVDLDKAKSLAHVELSQRMTAQAVFAALMERFSTYMVLKPYHVDAGNRDATNEHIYNTWVSLLGADRVAQLAEPERVVDVIFGLLAQETKKVAYFEQELKGRQRPEQVETVMKSLRTIHSSSDRKKVNVRWGGTSILTNDPGGKRTRRLI